jgi:uncharacterized RDD family membrane protein YckC
MIEETPTEPAESLLRQHHNPAPLLKRMIAFGMDFILIVLLLQLLAHFMPNFWGQNTKEEFQQLLQQATLLPKEEQMDAERMAEFLNHSALSPETYEMLMAMVVWACFTPILYFFIGERFFGGQSLGKATFRMRSVPFAGGTHPSAFRIFLRATIKGLSTLVLITPFLLPGLMNFIFCFINRNRRCLHDLAGSTLTVQELPQSTKDS